MKHDQLLMATAEIWAQGSKAERLKVGAVIAREGRIIATGYNGTAPGDCNICEDSENRTKDSVIHAEENAILFCAKHGVRASGCAMYTLVAPCLACARKIVSVGIVRVVYRDTYRSTEGVELLQRLGVEVEMLGQGAVSQGRPPGEMV